MQSGIDICVGVVQHLHRHWCRCRCWTTLYIYIGAHVDANAKRRSFAFASTSMKMTSGLFVGLHLHRCCYASTSVLMQLLSNTDADTEHRHLYRRFIFHHCSLSLSTIAPVALNNVAIYHHWTCNKDIESIFLSIIFLLPSIKLMVLG